MWMTSYLFGKGNNSSNNSHDNDNDEGDGPGPQMARRSARLHREEEEHKPSAPTSANHPSSSLSNLPDAASSSANGRAKPSRRKRISRSHAATARTKEDARTTTTTTRRRRRESFEDSGDEDSEPEPTPEEENTALEQDNDDNDDDSAYEDAEEGRGVVHETYNENPTASDDDDDDDNVSKSVASDDDEDDDDGKGANPEATFKKYDNFQGDDDEAAEQRLKFFQMENPYEKERNNKIHKRIQMTQANFFKDDLRKFKSRAEQYKISQGLKKANPSSEEQQVKTAMSAASSGKHPSQGVTPIRVAPTVQQQHHHQQQQHSHLSLLAPQLTHAEIARRKRARTTAHAGIIPPIPIAPNPVLPQLLPMARSTQPLDNSHEQQLSQQRRLRRNMRRARRETLAKLEKGWHARQVEAWAQDSSAPICPTTNRVVGQLQYSLDNLPSEVLQSNQVFLTYVPL